MGPLNRTYIIAEAGVNHNGSVELAVELIDAAVEAGADAVKFQTFKPELLVSAFAGKADYQKKLTDSEESQLDMLRKLQLPEESYPKLLERCRARGIHFLSTPFDLDSLSLLTETYDIPTIKLPSGEITNPLLLYRTARTGKPIILSTGMSTLGEIETALSVIAFGYVAADEKPSRDKILRAYASEAGQRALRDNVTLLHCTTEYPAPLDEVNLNVMDTLKRAFNLKVGYSDHTQGIAIPVAAAAKGAAVIEKHFTLDRGMPGPDHQASLEPMELKQMVSAIRDVEKALGNPIKHPTASEINNKLVVRKSLVAIRAIRKGEPFSEENLAIKRPGTGRSPMEYWEMLGQPADRDYERDEPVQ